MEEVFISHVFDEFKEEVREIENEINNSPFLKQYNIRPRILSNNEAYYQNPKENSVKLLQDSEYVVILIGETAGSFADDGITYLEHEINAALSSDKVGVYVYVIRKSSDIDFKEEEYEYPPATRDLIERLKSKVTISHKRASEIVLLPKDIVNDIGKDIHEVVNREEYTESILDKEVLNVSGFDFEKIGKIPQGYRSEIEQVYFSQDETNQSLNHFHSQMQGWREAICDNLSHGAHNDALNNVEKILENNGTDMFGCFWGSRILAIYGDNTSDWNKAIALGEKSCSITERKNLPFLKALSMSAIGLSYLKIGNYTKAFEYLELSQKSKHNWETEYYIAKCYIQSFIDNQTNESLLDNAANSLLKIFKSKPKYFSEIESKFSEDYSDIYPKIRDKISIELSKTYMSMYKAYMRTSKWAQEKLDIKRKEVTKPDSELPIMVQAYHSSRLVYSHYILLKKCIAEIYFKLGRQLDSEKKLEVKVIERKNNYIGAIQSLDLMIEELESLKSQLDLCKKKEEKIGYLCEAKGKMGMAKITVFILVVILVSLVLFDYAGIYTLVPFSIYSQIGFVLLFSMGLFFRFKENEHSEDLDIEVRNKKKISEAINLHVNSSLELAELPFFNGGLNHDKLVESDWLKEKLTGLYAEKEKAGLDLSEMEHSLQVINASFDNNINELQEISSQIDEFEQYVVSAHKGQYCTLIFRKAGFNRQSSNDRTIGMYSVFTNTNIETEKDGSTYSYLVKGASRLDAWVTSKLTRSGALIDYIKNKLEDDSELTYGDVVSVPVYDKEIINEANGTVIVDEVYVNVGDYVTSSDTLFSIKIDGEGMVQREISSPCNGYVYSLLISEKHRVLANSLALVIQHSKSCSAILEYVILGGDIETVEENKALFTSGSYKNLEVSTAIMDALVPTLKSYTCQQSASKTIKEILVPVLPESVADATVATWYVSEGDKVTKDQVIVDIETDKVVLEVPAKFEGVIGKVFYAEGSTVLGEQKIAELVIN
ncbi:biotin/lipoyl-containing protein [Thalassotalea sp. G2M2-11]|uniref:biotin/lipoyl-containing protein n=1 Tax=Thalassotalea sp. G2M2-11 TaxID=2787627 RepID=UPI0019D0FBA3|nr:biotin/lipoyl-containing protein [Thalassotalea sp. G2M2-11]